MLDNKPFQMEDPKTDEQWQLAVNLAGFCLLVDSARLYGLISGGPKFNVARCEEILTSGRARGFHPAPAQELTERFAGLWSGG